MSKFLMFLTILFLSPAGFGHSEEDMNKALEKYNQSVKTMFEDIVEDRPCPVIQRAVGDVIDNSNEIIGHSTRINSDKYFATPGSAFLTAHYLARVFLQDTECRRKYITSQDWNSKVFMYRNRIKNNTD